MIRIVEDFRDVDTYLALREQVGWVQLTREQAKLAINNCQKVFTVFDDERAIGMGRIVSDMAVISYIQDLIIVPEYQGQHLGSYLLNTMIEYVDSIKLEGSQMMLCLMCAKGREKFYERHGFIARPTKNLGPGMIQYLRND